MDAARRYVAHMEIGYWLSSEEHNGPTLVTNAKRAEDAGFEHLVISDHFHPWTRDRRDRAGHVAHPARYRCHLPANPRAPSDRRAGGGDLAAVAGRSLLGKVVLGDDPTEWKQQIDEYRHAGFTHVTLHNVAKEQDAFIEFASELA